MLPLLASASQSLKIEGEFAPLRMLKRMHRVWALA